MHRVRFASATLAATLFASFAVFGLLQAAPEAARAAETTEATAQQQASTAHHRAGDAAMADGRIDDAIREYMAAYELSPQPALLYNLGRAYAALGRYPDALDYLERFDRDANPQTRALVQGLPQLIAETRARVSALTLECNVDEAEVRLDKTILGKTPLAVGLRVNAGEHVVEVTKEGYESYRRSLSFPGGGESRIEANLAPRTTMARINVSSNVAGVGLSVDGVERGVLPAELLLGAGSHDFEARKDGYVTVRKSVVLEPGEKRALSLDLSASSPLYTKWWFWTGIGAVVAGSAVAVIALTSERPLSTGTIPPGSLRSAW
jgi:tetratricopeptide (TPR) repeat protein